MTKNKFVHIIKLLRKHWALENKFADALEVAIDGYAVVTLSESLREAFSLVFIESTSKSLWETVEWALYETDLISGNLEHDWFVKEEITDKLDSEGPLAMVFDDKMWAPRNPEELWELLEAHRIWDTK